MLPFLHGPAVIVHDSYTYSYTSFDSNDAAAAPDCARRHSSRLASLLAPDTAHFRWRNEALKAPMLKLAGIISRGKGLLFERTRNDPQGQLAMAPSHRQIVLVRT